MPSEQQIGIVGGKEPTLCAVSGRDVRGKHAVTHYGPDGTYVRVLNQFDHLWAKAASAYGFPEPIIQDEQPPEFEVFVLQDLSEVQANLAGDYLANQSSPSADLGEVTKEASAIPGDTAPRSKKGFVSIADSKGDD